MKKSVPFASVTLAGALTLALTLALAPAGSQAQTTSRAAKSIPVTVVNGKAVVGSSAQAQVSSSAPTLSWKLQTPGYRFTSTSIDFGSAAGSFDCKVSSSGQVIECVRNSASAAAAGSGNYTITVEAVSGPKTVSSKPNVVIMSD